MRNQILQSCYRVSRTFLHDPNPNVYNKDWMYHREKEHLESLAIESLRQCGYDPSVHEIRHHEVVREGGYDKYCLTVEIPQFVTIQTPFGEVRQYV